jgi:hypothetical protein
MEDKEENFGDTGGNPDKVSELPAIDRVLRSGCDDLSFEPNGN